MLSIHPALRTDTLASTADEYLSTVRHLTSWKSRRSEVRAWVEALGDRPIDALTKLDVLRARSGWVEAGVSPKTCNNRLVTLRHWCETLDVVPPPTARVRPLRVARTPPVVVPVATIEAVLRRLAEAERAGVLRDARTRARLGVLATTGRRPSEVMRAVPDDLDWERSIWRVRDGKGGWTPGGVHLTASCSAAWRLFAAADAWGRWDQTSWVRTLRRHGWPEGLRPYSMRHSVGIAMSEQGIDLADVGAALGHVNPVMTRSHYVPLLNPRMRKAAEALESARPIRALQSEEAGQLALPFGPRPVRRGPKAAKAAPAAPGAPAAAGEARARTDGRVVRPDVRAWGG